MSKHVHLHKIHEESGHVVDFAGFSLPLWYKGIVMESLAVRNSVGIFDVSHMGRMLVRGDDSCAFLDLVTTNSVKSLTPREGQYSLVCNEQGGIKDDVLVFNLAEHEYLIVYNAATRTKDYDWFCDHAKGKNVELEDISDKVAMFALQGPNACDVLQKTCSIPVEVIPRFGCAWCEVAGVKSLISRTGYTGEDGFEIFVWDSPIDNPHRAISVWTNLLQVGEPDGIELCGLGARDLLRLEAGLCLYGTDIDESINPLEARLGFVVKLDKNFIGRAPLQQVKQKGPNKTRIGLMTMNRVIPRHGFRIFQSGQEVGEVTSGSLSPILDKGIAMGYVHSKGAYVDSYDVMIRERIEPTKLVKPPFYDTQKYGYARRA